jgi:ribosomal protein S18 acetylase RimI-like enzyme
MSRGPRLRSMLIRKATLNDSVAISTCLFLAMEDIVYKLIGEHDQVKAQAFMTYFVERENNQYSHQNCWVVEGNHGVVAAVNVYDGGLLRELRHPVIEHLRSRFGRDFNHGDETQPGEYYIDALGVNSDQQNRGVGTNLLRFLINEYVNRQNKTLGLLVDEGNPNAKRLYLKLGFKSVGRKVLFGKTLEHLQITGE